jgi:hypothetical protein
MTTLGFFHTWEDPTIESRILTELIPRKGATVSKRFTTDFVAFGEASLGSDPGEIPLCYVEEERLDALLIGSGGDLPLYVASQETQRDVHFHIIDSSGVQIALGLYKLLCVYESLIPESFDPSDGDSTLEALNFKDFQEETPEVLERLAQRLSFRMTLEEYEESMDRILIFFGYHGFARLSVLRGILTKEKSLKGEMEKLLHLLTPDADPTKAKNAFSLASLSESFGEDAVCKGVFLDEKEGKHNPTRYYDHFREALGHLLISSASEIDLSESYLFRREFKKVVLDRLLQSQPTSFREDTLNYTRKIRNGFIARLKRLGEKMVQLDSKEEFPLMALILEDLDHFNFEWKSLEEVIRGTKKYDLIHTSNIIDWIDDEDTQQQFMRSIVKILRHNGVATFRSIFGIIPNYTQRPSDTRGTQGVSSTQGVWTKIFEGGRDFDATYFYAKTSMVFKKDVDEQLEMVGRWPYFRKFYPGIEDDEESDDPFYRYRDIVIANAFGLPLTPTSSGPRLQLFLASQEDFATAVKGWVEILDLFKHKIREVSPESLTAIKLLQENIGDELGPPAHTETFKTFLDGWRETVGASKSISPPSVPALATKFVDFLKMEIEEAITETQLVKVASILGEIEFLYISISRIIIDLCEYHGVQQSHYKTHEILDLKHSTDLFSLFSGERSGSDFYAFLKGIKSGNRVFSGVYNGYV